MIYVPGTSVWKTGYIFFLRTIWTDGVKRIVFSYCDMEDRTREKQQVLSIVGRDLVWAEYTVEVYRRIDSKNQG